VPGGSAAEAIRATRSLAQNSRTTGRFYKAFIGRGRLVLVASATSGNTSKLSAEVVRSAVPYVAGADRDQGLPKPDSRVAPGPRNRRSERDELGFGVLVALLLAADLLRRAVGSARVREFSTAVASNRASIAALAGVYVRVRRSGSQTVRATPEHNPSAAPCVDEPELVQGRQAPTAMCLAEGPCRGHAWDEGLLIEQLLVTCRLHWGVDGCLLIEEA
jgi:hypothetical protein